MIQEKIVPHTLHQPVCNKRFSGLTLHCPHHYRCNTATQMTSLRWPRHGAGSESPPSDSGHSAAHQSTAYSWPHVRKWQLCSKGSHAFKNLKSDHFHQNTTPRVPKSKFNSPASVCTPVLAMWVKESPPAQTWLQKSNDRCSWDMQLRQLGTSQWHYPA